MPVPPRIAAAVEVLDPQPGDVVLEAGGGNGVSAQLICSRLGAGRLIALDRSAVATQRTLARNAEHAEAGRLEAVTGSLGDLRGRDATVDRALTVNVNVFWTSPADAELEALRRVLRPGGLVVLAWGAEGPQPAARIVDAVTTGLDRHGFTAVASIDDPRLVGLTAVRP
ncbi:MAG: class I SAM-dependent methyltransferase [Intrasporangium sp.]|nr:class I SAM-dependent methyltransferase [Intrasporangium sp.]